MGACYTKKDIYDFIHHCAFNDGWVLKHVSPNTKTWPFYVIKKGYNNAHYHGNYTVMAYLEYWFPLYSVQPENCVESVEIRNRLFGQE
jgi:hypothetical protein